MKTRSTKSTATIVAEINAAHPADITSKCEFCSAPVVVRPSDPGFKSARDYAYAVCRASTCRQLSNGYSSTAA